MRGAELFFVRWNFHLPALSSRAERERRAKLNYDSLASPYARASYRQSAKSL